MSEVNCISIHPNLWFWNTISSSLWTFTCFSSSYCTIWFNTVFRMCSTIINWIWSFTDTSCRITITFICICIYITICDNTLFLRWANDWRWITCFNVFTSIIATTSWINTPFTNDLRFTSNIE